MEKNTSLPQNGDVNKRNGSVFGDPTNGGMMPHENDSSKAGNTRTKIQELNNEKDEKPNLDKLADEILDQWELVPANDAVYVMLPDKETGIKVVELGSRDFTGFLYDLFLNRGGILSEINPNFVKKIQAILRYKANQQKQQNLFKLVGVDNGVYYYNLNAKTGCSIRIGKDGWDKVASSPVRFMFEGKQVAPKPPEKIDWANEKEAIQKDLKDLLGVGDHEFKLILTAMLEYLRPDTEMPILHFQGLSGTAKTTKAECIARLIDSNPAFMSTLKSFPHIDVVAHNRWVLVIDNISSITKRESDLLCCVSTGGTQYARKLYTNTGLTEIPMLNPVIITSTVTTIGEYDLTERMLKITCDKPLNYRLNSRMKKEMGAIRPRVMGFLFDTLAKALTEIEHVSDQNLFRMADYHLLGRSVERVLEWPNGSFDQALLENQKQIAFEIVSQNTLLTQVHSFIEKTRQWKGEPSALKQKLIENSADNSVKKELEQLKINLIGMTLESHSPYLGIMGVNFQYDRKAHRVNGAMKRIYEFTYTP